jgi:hypothetical protein
MRAGTIPAVAGFLRVSATGRLAGFVLFGDLERRKAMKKTKKSKRTKGKAAAKDLRVGKRAGGAVKGGRITNVNDRGLAYPSVP